MSEGLNRLADAYGIEVSYISETGELRVVSDAIKVALLKSMAVDDGEIAAAQAGFADREPEQAYSAPAGGTCYAPNWLARTRVWGVTVQLYGVVSARNHGMGDFEDLARLAELAALAGADFVGVNPLHALFWAEPDRCSPYACSSRRFLNPLYIAVDQLPGARNEPVKAAALRDESFVQYGAVAALKRAALEDAFRSREEANPEFEAFIADGGDDLAAFALFEALSDVMAARGLGSGWHNWPARYRDRKSPEVTRFEAANGGLIRFHQWVQWVAARQLQQAQSRARQAGMRIGLYLDFAVGVAPDGAATWSDPELVLAGARVGAPPDMMNHLGQNWGLAPLAPKALADRAFEPLARDFAAVMRSAGALRIDHAMSLQRLYWIPEGHNAVSGTYVRYPLNGMLDRLAEASRKHETIIIGEDLGTVPEGFRETMRERDILGYRIFYFERVLDGEFLSPASYPVDVLGCLSTHDLPPVRGWWRGLDIDARRDLSLFDASAAEAAANERVRERRLLLTSLAGEGLLSERSRAAAMSGDGLPDDMPDEDVAAMHAFLARTPCRLVAVQLEDLAGAAEPVNVPGTYREYPNWRRKLPVAYDDLPNRALYLASLAAMSRERPRQA